MLAEDVASPIDLPPWDNSAMDGYAVRAADVRGASGEHPKTLHVIETVLAGQFPERTLAAGEATRIATGAPTPAGADCVIRQEDADPQPGDRVSVRDDRDAGHNVRRQGDDIRRGTIVLTQGTLLGPAGLGVLASVGHGTPLVHRPPRVAFLASGDEITDLDHREEIRAGRKIASSNSYTLDALIRHAGAIPIDLGIARDTKASVRERLTAPQAGTADLVITSGGVSVGERDFVRDVLAELGGEVKVWRVRMRPGAPLGFGMLRGRPWIGLPGNPVSTMVTFELFARPAIRRLAGDPLPFRRTIPVRVAEPIQLGARLRHFLRVTLEPGGRDGVPAARLTGPQGSGILTSMARAHALLIVPETCETVAAGTVLTALVLDDPQHVAAPPF